MNPSADEFKNAVEMKSKPPVIFILCLPMRAALE
jgi:hypothetical protein